MKTRRICKSSDTRQVFKIVNETALQVIIGTSKNFSGYLCVNPKSEWKTSGEFATSGYWIRLADNAKLRIVENLTDGTLYAKVYI